jgi:hypothetical protein
MAEGVDYSFARIPGAALAGAGKAFVVRYLYPDGQGGKGLDASEVNDLHAHGIQIAVVFESSAQRALSGFAAGVADAEVSEAQLAVVGLQKIPVYFATDWSVTPAQFAAVDDYLRGAASVLGANRVGLYGGKAIIDHCDGSTAAWLWQTYAWSAGQWNPHTNIQQYLNGQTVGGGSVDLCRNQTAEFGQNPPSKSTPKEGMELIIFTSQTASTDGVIPAGYSFIREGGPLQLLSEQEFNAYRYFADPANGGIPTRFAPWNGDDIRTLSLSVGLMEWTSVAGNNPIFSGKVIYDDPAKADYPKVSATVGNVTVDNTTVLAAITSFQTQTSEFQDALVTAINALPAGVRAKIIAPE